MTKCGRDKIVMKKMQLRFTRGILSYTFSHNNPPNWNAGGILVYSYIVYKKTSLSLMKLGYTSFQYSTMHEQLTFN